jgi:hypothetical protein
MYANHMNNIYNNEVFQSRIIQELPLRTNIIYLRFLYVTISIVTNL